MIVTPQPSDDTPKSEGVGEREGSEGHCGLERRSGSGLVPQGVSNQRYGHSCLVQSESHVKVQILVDPLKIL